MATPTSSKRDGKKGLSVATIGFMTAAAIVTSLRGLPTIALTEMTMFVYLGFSIVFFLVPGALVSAELGGMYPGSGGGVYRWVKEAFNERWGFTAQWLQWIQNVVWYPTGIAFVAAGAAYVIGRPDLASNRYYIGVFVIVVYWLCTLIVLKGVEFFAKIASIMFIAGTVIPGVVLLGLFGYWIASGHPIGWEGTIGSGLGAAGHPKFFPTFTGLGSVAFLAGFILLFAGVETQAVHLREMRRPRSFPSAIALAALISAGIFVFGSLAIAGIVPFKHLGLLSAVFYAFQLVLTHTLHVSGWLARAIDLLIAIGGISGVLAWLGGPPRGMLVTTQDGALPPFMQKMNKHEMPIGILMGQGIVVSLVACIYFLEKNVSVGFFLIGALTIALYLIMYLLMYMTVLRLRYKRPRLERPFVVPGGKSGIWVVAGVGFLGAAFALVTSFFPPTLLPIGTPVTYVMLVAGGTVVLGGLPILLFQIRRKNWVNKSIETVEGGQGAGAKEKVGTPT
jgi:amino acid transporter